MDSPVLNDRFFEGSFPIIPAAEPEFGHFGVQGCEEIAYRRPLVDRNSGV